MGPNQFDDYPDYGSQPRDANGQPEWKQRQATPPQQGLPSAAATPPGAQMQGNSAQNPGGLVGQALTDQTEDPINPTYKPTPLARVYGEYEAKLYASDLAFDEVEKRLEEWRNQYAGGRSSRDIVNENLLDPESSASQQPIVAPLQSVVDPLPENTGSQQPLAANDQPLPPVVEPPGDNRPPQNDDSPGGQLSVR